MTSTVGWDRSPVVEGWAGLPTLDGPRSCDVCVVGLGASGLAAVRWGVERGLAVVGLDAGRVGGGAAGRNGGFLLGGVARFHHQVVDQLGEALAVDLYRRTLTEIDRLANRLGPRLRRTGSLRLAGLPGPPGDEAEEEERAREEADCQRHLAALRRAGIAAEWFEGRLGRGLRLPNDAVVNPAERCLVEAGGLSPEAQLFEHSPVQRIEPDSHPRVTTDRGTVTASAVVVCVDGGLERVVPWLAPRVRTARLQMLATAPVPPTLDGAVYCRWGYDYAQQTPDGGLMVGGGRDLHAVKEWLDQADNPEPVRLSQPPSSRSARVRAMGEPPAPEVGSGGAVGDGARAAGMDPTEPSARSARRGPRARAAGRGEPTWSDPATDMTRRADALDASAAASRVVVPGPTAGVQRYLDGLAQRFVGGAGVTVVDRWAGLVAFTDDGLPICELVAENVAVAGAYNGTGNVVGPLVARAAVALALGEPPVDWPPVGRASGMTSRRS